MRRTALYSMHRALGARLIGFGGWEMPLHYSSITDEHLAVRKASGIFDISHMGEIFIKGEGARAFTNSAFTNDSASLEVGQGQYSMLCNDAGGVIDDLYLFRIDTKHFLCIVNASRIESVWEWLHILRKRADFANDFADVSIENVSEKMSALAIQGPRSAAIFKSCFPQKSLCGRNVKQAAALKKNEIGGFESDGQKLWISRTGYTGEDGFEMFANHDCIVTLWRKIIDTGQSKGLQCIGLGARDTLRIEMAYPLYGCELSPNISPLQADLGSFVKLKKRTFVGRESLCKQKSEGLKRRSIALKMIGSAPPPRTGYAVKASGNAIGRITSGAFSPSLRAGIAMAFIDIGFAQTGKDLEIEIRGRSFPAIIVKKPFYKKT